MVTKSVGSKADSDYRRYNTNAQQVVTNVDQQLTNKYPDYQKNFQRQDIVNERTILEDQGKYQLMSNSLKNNSYYASLLYWYLIQGFAIATDGIKKRKQVQLIGEFNSEIAKAFNISALPSNIILNEKREIIGINLSDEQFLLLL